jgi:hypothetical protein
VNTAEEIAAAVSEAARLIDNPADAELVRDFLAATASFRPHHDSPGTEREQMRAIQLWCELPAETRRDHADEAWGKCLDAAILHRQPYLIQARAWRRAQRRAAQPATANSSIPKAIARATAQAQAKRRRARR